MKLEFIPWTLPQFCSQKMPPKPRENGFLECPKWSLKDIDEETLSDMCDDFRSSVFEKAGKKDPKK